MKNQAIYYSVGPLLYCPADNTSIAASVISQRFGTHFSLALCLEDTINDNFVAEAENLLVASINNIYESRQDKDFYLPKIFIRVRSPRQIKRTLPPFWRKRRARNRIYRSQVRLNQRRFLSPADHRPEQRPR